MNCFVHFDPARVMVKLIGIGPGDARAKLLKVFYNATGSRVAYCVNCVIVCHCLWQVPVVLRMVAVNSDI